MNHLNIQKGLISNDLNDENLYIKTLTCFHIFLININIVFRPKSENSFVTKLPKKHLVSIYDILNAKYHYFSLDYDWKCPFLFISFVQLKCSAKILVANDHQVCM